jgi:repressor LexA
MSNLGNKKAMARNLKYYIDRSGKSQKEIAELIEVAPSTFNAWVKGVKYQRIDSIEKLANLFGILKSELIEDRAEMQKKNDALTDIVIRLRGDDEFLSLVAKLHTLDKSKIKGVNQMLDALLQ